jgi:hypothetical protein
MVARGAVAAGDAIYARYSSELQNPRSCDDQVTELRQALERERAHEICGASDQDDCGTRRVVALSSDTFDGFQKGSAS